MKPEIFQESMKLYTAFDPEGALRVKNADVSRYAFYPTHRGEANLSLGEDIYFHAPEGAAKEAERWFKALPLKDIDHLYIFGTGLGYYYEALKGWLNEDSSRFVVFLEDDPAVLSMLFKTERGLEMLKKDNVFIHLISVKEDVVDFFSDKRLKEIFAAFHRKNPLLTSLTHYVKTREKLVFRIKSQIFIALSWQKILHADKEALLEKVTRNVIGNVLRVSNSASFHALEGHLKGIPALICGAGPSIVKEIETLKDAKKKCLLIGSGTGTNVLNKNGIFPHFFVGLDPTESQESRIRTNQSYVIPVFHKLRFSSIASKILSGEHVLLRGHESPSTAWFEKELGIDQMEEIETGISSTTFGIAMARRLGCDPIILIGLDLAYTDNQRYPDGTSSIAFGGKKQQDEVTFKPKNLLIGSGYKGEEVLTKIDWLIESDTITEFLEKHPEVKLINATKGGLSIEKAPHRSLDNLLNSLPSIDDMEGRLHMLMQKGKLKGITPKETLGVVNLWKSHGESFLESLKNSSDFGSISSFKELEEAFELFYERERKNPFYDTLFPSYGEVQNGYLILAKTRMLRAEVLNDRDGFVKSRDVYILNFFSLWIGIAERYLDALQREVDQFENEQRLFSVKVEQNIPPFKDHEGVQKKYYLSGSLFSLKSPHEERLFYEDGTVKACLEYVRGKLSGTVSLYYPNGRLKREIQFKDGLLHGFEKYFDEAGTLIFNAEFKDGRPWGVACEYYQSGKILRKTLFDTNGKRISLKEWDSNGNETALNRDETPSNLAEALKDHLDDIKELKSAFGDERHRLFL